MTRPPRLEFVKQQSIQSLPRQQQAISSQVRFTRVSHLLCSHKAVPQTFERVCPHAHMLIALPTPLTAKPKKNWFKSDDPDAVVPQHDWRQGPDFRSQANPESGYAVWGSNR